MGDTHPFIERRRYNVLDLGVIDRIEQVAVHVPGRHSPSANTESDCCNTLGINDAPGQDRIGSKLRSHSRKLELIWFQLSS